MRKTSPSSRRARKTNSIWRWLKRSDWARRGSGMLGGRRQRASSSAGSIGPAGEGGAWPTSCGARAGGGVASGLGGGRHVEARRVSDRPPLQSADAGESKSRRAASTSSGAPRSSPPSGRRAGTPAVLEQLIAAGADVFRLNFSHAGPERQAQTIDDIRAAAERVGREVAVLGDLPGPKLRIGELRDDFAELETGHARDPDPARGRGRPRDDPGLLAGGHRPAARTSSSTSPTARSGCASATPSADGVDCEVEVGGTLSSHKGMNIPGGADLPATTDVDLGWVEFAVENGVDLLAVSFVSTAADLVPVRERLRRARLRHPADRQDRAAGRRPSNVEEIVRVGDRRDHGRPRRPRDRSAAGRRCRSCRSG